MSLDPDREPITRPVFVWLEIAAQLAHHGEGGLATAIRQAMDGRRLGNMVSHKGVVAQRMTGSP